LSDQTETADGVYSRPFKGYTADAEVKGEMVALILAPTAAQDNVRQLSGC
jgi:hypothetical protein